LRCNKFAEYAIAVQRFSEGELFEERREKPKKKEEGSKRMSLATLPQGNVIQCAATER